MGLYSNDPSTMDYFILPVLILLGLLISLLSLNLFFSKSKREKARQRLDSEQIFLSLPLIEQEKTKNFRTEKKRKERALKFRYLSVFLLTRCSTWAKSPFMYTLFSKYHRMSISEIGVLYIIDAFSSLIFGPLTGNWADKYGRKLFCLCYCVCIALSMCLRAVRYIPFVYAAQIITGFGAGLIFTTYESWINFEAEKHLKYGKQRFLEKLFKSQNLLDTITSLIVGGFSAILYSYFGILAPIFLSIAFASFSVFFMLLCWDENRPNSDNE
jgi:MFS family permease